jgi:6-phosphogluconolactonase/glucosamine-6-phosphate isomerase/deaminase
MTNLRYIKIKNIEQAAGYVSDHLLKPLKDNKKVLWLIPGGSGLELAVLVAKQLDSMPYPGSLTITLTDERYGPAGHKDSNYQQLINRGFNLRQSRLLPVLAGLDLKTEAQHYGQMLDQAIFAADYSVVLGGMGEDGHIFGIKPGSPAVTSKETVCGYKSDDYERLAPTAAFLKRINEIIMYVMGEVKHQQLQRLNEDIDPKDQPAQLLKEFKKVTILNDWKGDSI